MAHVINLKYGSPTSWAYIDLTDANHGNVNYYPGTPADGADDITESGKWRIAGSSVADLLAKIQAIENVFRRAGAYNEDEVGDYQVRLTMLLSGDSDTWESPIYEGRLELAEDVLGVDWANWQTDVILIWRRAGYWERLVAVPITNSNGTAQTTGVNISNRSDESGISPNISENYVDIDSAGVPGDLPAPAIIEIYDSVGNNIRQVYVCHNAKSQPTHHYWAEGETGVGDTANALRNAGAYHRYTIAGGSPGGYLEYNDLGMLWIYGSWLRILISAQFTGTVKIRPYISFNTTRYFGPASILTGSGGFKVYDLGLLRKMPIGIYNNSPAGGPIAALIGINVVPTVGLDFDLDYIHYDPVDSFAKAVVDASGYTTGCIQIDSHNGRAVLSNVPGATCTMRALGTLYGGIYLEPGLAQHLTFKTLPVDGSDTLDVITSLRVSCWARKRTL
jgi:hypothetical protein